MLSPTANGWSRAFSSAGEQWYETRSPGWPRESELMVVRVIQLAEQLVHIGWGIPSSEGDRVKQHTT